MPACHSVALFLIALALGVAPPAGRSAALPDTQVIASRVQHALDGNGMPASEDWDRAKPVTFSWDWQGKNEDSQRLTEVKLLWDPETLYVRFRCGYRAIHVFDDAEPSGRRDHLWDRDVAEVFLQPDRLGTHFYKEFEVSPNGQWVDLDITPDGGTPLGGDLRRQVSVDAGKKEWTAVLAIPLKSLTAKFDPSQSWRVNFYRCEGADPQRAYLAWRPTNSPQPNFHVPASFGELRFEP